MTVRIDPEIQQAHDRVADRYRAAADTVAQRLRVRQPPAPMPEPAVARLEPNDLSARAADYAEADDEPEPPARPRPAPTRLADDDDEVPAFRWDEL